MIWYINGQPLTKNQECAVPLGVQGDNDTTAYTANCADWLEAWPNGIIALLLKAPDGSEPYVANTATDAETGVVTWTITAFDTAIPGYGWGELRIVQADEVKKSWTFRTYIRPSILAEVGTPPAPTPDWVDDLLEEASTAMGATRANAELAADAADDAKDAQEAAETAQGKAEDAQEAAEAAQTAAEGEAEDAEAWAKGTRNGSDVDSSDPAYHNNAKYYAGVAQGISEDTAGKVADAEAWAAGTRNGTDVGSSDPAYHNNSKYYSQQASGAVTAAEGKVADAEAWAAGTRDGSDVGSDDPAYHNNAKYYSEQAAASALAVEDEAQDAEAWAKGTRGGEPVTTSDPEYENNSKYYAQQAEAAQEATAEYVANGYVMNQIDLSQYATNSHGITGSDKWSSNGRSKDIPIDPAKVKKIVVTAPADHNSVFVLLKTNEYVNNRAPDWATGETTRHTVAEGETVTVNVPSDCTYMTVNVGWKSGTEVNWYSLPTVKMPYRRDVYNSDRIAENTTDITALKARELVDVFPAEDELPICVAHRGIATSGYPEETIPTYKDAISKGWKYLEADMRKTSDGVWVLCHDATINDVARNADGTTISSTVTISETTYQDLLAYDFGIKAGAQFAGTKIATLDGFLNLCNKAHVYPVIEVKDSGITEAEANAVWAIVQKYQMQNRCIWLCSSVGGVQRFLALNPYAPAIQTSASDWGGGSSLSERPSACDYQTGKNRVFHARIASAFASKQSMDNFVTAYKAWGIYAGVYAPTTTAGIQDCSDRLDLGITENYKYSDVKEAEIEG